VARDVLNSLLESLSSHNEDLQLALAMSASLQDPSSRSAQTRTPAQAGLHIVNHRQAGRQDATSHPPPSELGRGRSLETDEDLQLAIALSLADAARTAASQPPVPAARPAGNLPPAPLPAPPPPPPPPVSQEDDSANAAIRAALRGDSVALVPFHFIQRCTESFAQSRSIGRGAYGTVFRGVDDGGAFAPFEFAAKRLECENPDDRDALERMTVAEIQTLTRFTHPHIIRLLGYCRDEGASILLYEYEPLGSLEGHLEDANKASAMLWSYRARIVAGVLTAVNFLHKHDPSGPCYHRDIKPGNIVLTASYSPKLIDCGLSRFLPRDQPEQGSRRTLIATSLRALGTQGFMCPTYARTNAFNEKSEVYSIGVTILQIITGKVDFTSPCNQEQLSLSDLIDEPDTKLVADSKDVRPPVDEAQSAVDTLAEMSAACVAKLRSRISLIALLRQAKMLSAALPVQCEMQALRAQIEQMSSELRQLRIQGELVQQQQQQLQQPQQETLTCELCYDGIVVSESSGMFCTERHFVCAGCAPMMVQTFLERVSESDTLLEAHRARDGRLPCFRHTPAFDPQCSAMYAESSLAAVLPEEVFVQYRQSQNEVIENRVWQEQNERFQQEIARILHEQGLETQRRDEQATVDFLRHRYPNARMCPRCRFGPVINENCPALDTHHGDRVRGSQTRISNACGQCGFFTRHWNEWQPWDGILRAGPPQ
jgi:serine/threonine protein kinase